jgi:type I restriction enzyme, S subunit
MTNEQDGHTVGDYVTLQRGTTYMGPLVGEPGPALLGLGSIEPGGGFRHGHFKTYGGECPPKLMLFPGELYVALKGATKDGEMIGSVARVPSTVPSGRLTQDTVKLVFQNTSSDDAGYLYWLLRTPQYRAYCRGHATGSAVVALSRRDFLAFPVPQLNSFRQQLVALLDALENKMESNRRLAAIVPPLINTRVEAIHDNTWESMPVSSLASFVNGGAYTKGATGTGRMVIRIAELNSGPGLSTVYNDLDVPDEKLARPGDILMSWSGSLGLYRWVRDEAIINQHIFKVITDKYPAWLVHDRLLQVMPIFQSIAKDKATTMGHIQRGHLERTTVEMPPSEVIERLDQAIAPLWNRLLVAEREVLKLTAFRDALLPELLSDRPNVAEAREALEAVV